MAETGKKTDVALKEERILAFWKKQGVFEKSLKKPAPKGEFVFYDGPPFATGLPHSGSLLSSVSKDVIPRYKTMRGYFVRRRWGWDTHGLPIESLVEKKLGLKNKKDILAVGVETFNETARSMVLEYVHEWKRYIERVGRWVDFDHSYKTMDNTFIESVWWALKSIHNKGLLYEGRKVLMYCPHCETPLAKAEIAMDNTYKDVTDEAVTVKFKVKSPEKHNLPTNTYVLAWTTTPWTLPGNVALAVGPDIDYVRVEQNGISLILAKNRRAVVGEAAVQEEIKGSALVGIEYEPLYAIEKVAAHTGKKWRVLPADFVTTDEGTGIVHTAVIYGEDDYALGMKEGLPMVPLLNPNATYNADAPAFLQGEYIRKANPKVIEDLKSRDLLFSSQPHTHSYPHCYRCGTALIYNAVSSWFIDIQAIKQRMLAENKKINWSPEHLKHGRFEHNLENAPDWTISRNRFWASPLPIWKDRTGEVIVIGSLEELKEKTKKSGNTYLVMRHGESEKNIRGIVSCDPHDAIALTQKGREEVERRAKTLGTIDLIITSPFLRTTQTADIVRHALGLPASAVVEDARLSEYDHGTFDKKADAEFTAHFRSAAQLLDTPPEGGETVNALRQRVGACLYECEHTYAGKKILFVTHGYPAAALISAAQGDGTEKTVKRLDTEQPQPAEVVALDFVPLPHNKNYELDFHLPYIDRVTLVDEDGEALTRIPEVVDCWVESGSMPFAEYHYPFEHTDTFHKRSPGDFVSEYIGQTRAWFYYMHAMSIQLFDQLAFRNVVTTGTIVAADGAKLSKSKGNYTDPYVLFETYGADAFRYHLMSSVVMQAEDLMFRDEDVKDAHARVVNMLRNVLAFYTLFQHDAPATAHSGHVLDKWILARLTEVTSLVTDSFDRYNVTHATRPLKDFIDDLSTWYVRRSRDRMKGAGADSMMALGTLRHVLKTFAKVIAPVMPFIAEELFQATRDARDEESVHLAAWPEVKKSLFASWFRKDKTSLLVEDMKKVRAIASEALMLRQKVNIKVRQPLAKLSMPGTLSAELRALIAEEVNVKEVSEGAAELSLDTNLTPELVKEGDERELTRAVSEARKTLGLAPKDVARVVLDADGAYAVELSTGTTRFNVIPDAA